MARRICVKINNFIKALEREGKELYRINSLTKKKQKQKTIEISRIVSLIEPKYWGLGPMLKPLRQNLACPRLARLM